MSLISRIQDVIAAIGADIKVINARFNGSIIKVSSSTAATVPTPAASNISVFLDLTTGTLSQKDSSGVVRDLAASTAQTAQEFLTAQAKVNGIFRNGSCQDGTNAGYSVIPFSNDRPPPNTVGFWRRIGQSGAIVADDYLPVSVSSVYFLQADVRQLTRSANTRLFLGLIQYDVDNNPITLEYCSYITGSKTTLAAPLSVGDTTVTLASAANWLGTSPDGEWFKGISFYNYKDSTGFEYEHTVNPYTRWIFRPSGVGAWNDGGISGNVITLSQPFDLPNPAAGSGGVWPVGTVVANTNDGALYNYVLASAMSVTQSNNWSTLTAYIGGIDAGGVGDNTKFRAGVAKVKFFGLYNHYGASTDTLDIANIRIDITTLTRAIAGLSA